MMRTIEEIEAKLAKVLADDRLTQPSATVFENAPLALVQLELETRGLVLSWVLGRKFVHPRVAEGGRR